MRVKVEVYADAAAVARAAATVIAAEARSAEAARGRFVMAVSGGHMLWLMLRELALEDVPWKSVHLVQVDECVAPAGHPDRNLTRIEESLLRHSPLRADQVMAMPVDNADLVTAAAHYAQTLAQLAGASPVIDLVHLGLGADGHTASLVPGDPVLWVGDADVAVTQAHQGWRRMTLTYPILDRARSILWMITGSDKTEALRRLREGDTAIPAGRVRADHALALVDRMAAGEPGPRY
jgi:6-phosphogluconolactonase